MQIRFRDLRAAEGVQAFHEYVELPQIAEENPHVASIEPADVTLNAELSDQICRVDGSLVTKVVYTCSRCLDAFEAPLKADLEEQFTDDPKQATDEIYLISDGIVTVDPYIEEAVNLALEYRPLCSEDCKGLCPVCGTNRNETTCNCDTRTVDPRLAALEKLLIQEEPNPDDE